MGRTAVMKFIAKVKAGAKIDEITRDGSTLSIKIKAPANEGKANKAIIKLLADHFHVPQSDVTIRTGFSSKNKVIEISGFEKD